MTRQTAGLIEGVRPAPRTWRSKNSVGLGKVVNVDPTQGTVDVATTWGGFLRNVTVLGSGGTRQGNKDLPQVLNRKPKKDAEGKRTLDEYSKLERRDTMCVVAYLDGNVHQPVCWIFPPDYHEASFAEPNQKLDRHASDSYEHVYAADNPSADELRKMLEKSQQQDADDEDSPSPWDYPRQSNQEQVYPDRRRLKQPDPLQKTPPSFEPYDPSQQSQSLLPLGLGTYTKVGYGWDYSKDPKYDLGRQPEHGGPGAGGGLADGKGWHPRSDFQEKPFVAKYTKYPDGVEQLNERALGWAESGLNNFDGDYHPWRRHRENKIRFARGLRQNQRWGTYTELTRAGDVRILAEGLNKNVHPEMDDEQSDSDPQAAAMSKEFNWGSIYVMSRIEERHTTKGEWTYARKRWKLGGRLENFDTTVSEQDESDPDNVRKWGQVRTRVQRTWQTLTRKDATLGARGELTLAAGKVDDPDFYGPEAAWSRTDQKYGADAPRYQDRIKWRNRDCDEKADITICSIRPKLAEFGGDPPLRGDSDGGTITVVTRPLEKDNATIQLQSYAARHAATLSGVAATGKVEPAGDGATVSWSALASRNQAQGTFLARAGVGGQEGDDASLTLSAATRRDNATFAALAHAGEGESGNNAQMSLTARAHDDDAVITVLATTDMGSHAEVDVTAQPFRGPATINLRAQTTDQATVDIEADGEGHGTITIHATDDVVIAGDRDSVTVTARRIYLQAVDSIDLSAPSVTKNGIQIEVVTDPN